LLARDLDYLIRVEPGLAKELLIWAHELRRQCVRPKELVRNTANTKNEKEEEDNNKVVHVFSVELFIPFMLINSEIIKKNEI
jgi:hypothetical protein